MLDERAGVTYRVVLEVSILYWRCGTKNVGLNNAAKKSFNSLLEMLSLLPARLSLRWTSVSILYWRCHFCSPSATPREIRLFQFSIGDARLERGRVVCSHPPFCFNSLLEMHDAIVDGKIRNVYRFCFNSLLEMQREVQRDTDRHY